MIGDMFNDQLKAKVSALISDLAEYVRSMPQETMERQVSHRSAAAPLQNWWPKHLGDASSTGSQNDMRYAVFTGTRRLAIQDGDHISVYDTGDHLISGVSQAQSGGSTLSFTSQNGLVNISELLRI